mgnify:CR=1 FL=1
MNKSRIFTIEQIFEQYFNKRLGFREIVYICKMRNPSGAFRIYLRAAAYVKYDDESKEFIVGDRKVTFLKSISALLVSYGSFFMALFLAGFSSPVSDIYINNKHDSFLVVYWLAVVSLITMFLYATIFSFNEVFTRREIIGKFKLAFEGHLRQREISSTDIFCLLAAILFSSAPTLFVINLSNI